MENFSNPKKNWPTKEEKVTGPTPLWTKSQVYMSIVGQVSSTSHPVRIQTDTSLTQFRVTFTI